MKSYVSKDGRPSLAVQFSDGVDLKAELADTDIITATLTYPTAPSVTFVGLEIPLAENGRVVAPGQFVVVGEAGDVEVKTADGFADEFSEVSA